MTRSLAVVSMLSLLSGCGLWPGSSAPNGVVTGMITYAGLPAAGKLVTLVGADVRTSTDDTGRYTFRSVPAKRVQVLYASQGDRAKAKGDAYDVLPNEVQSWRSLPVDMTDGAGKEVPSFEVSYNGLLYPDRGVALVVSDKALVPFHFSVHSQGQKYRVKLSTDAKEAIWSSEWASDPTAVFGKAVAPGRYVWSVEIDGGDRGVGTTRDRGVDF
ncbi:MAG: hypothetical protein JWM80_2389 [Cyanobacteria bacterium RYN_339]|nr:hypothetical protein [Cyanobacteria bacterium RYN_339]